MDIPVKEWGPGIPEYTDNDLLVDMELHAFCTNIVAKSMQNNGYTIDGVILKHSPTQVIANKLGKRYYVIAAGGIYPNEGRISFKMKKQFSNFCLSQDVVPMFGSVGLMSHDAKRAAAGLALKYDGYMIKFNGLEDLSELTTPAPESDSYRAYCAEKIVEAYSTGKFDILYSLFSDEIQFHSQWVLNPLIGKERLIEYFDGKGQTIRNSNTRISGSVVMINNDFKRIDNFVLMSEIGKVCALIRQELKGNANWIFVSPKFDQNNKICELALNDPSLFDFVPYYAFE